MQFKKTPTEKYAFPNQQVYYHQKVDWSLGTFDDIDPYLGHASELVKIVVGCNKVDYVFRAAWLAQRSRFFANELSATRDKSSTSAPQPTKKKGEKNVLQAQGPSFANNYQDAMPTVDLINVQPRLFEVYVQLLFRLPEQGVYRLWESGDKFWNTKSLISLYCLGAYLGSPAVCDCAVDAIIAWLQYHKFELNLDVGELQRFYSGTESGCRGRRLWVDFILAGAGDGDPNSLVRKHFAGSLSHPATKAVSEDVARASLEPAKSPRPFEVSEDVPEVDMWCAYHEHDRFGEECYRKCNVDVKAQQRQLWLETNPNWREEMLSEMTTQQKRAWIEVEAAVSRPTSKDGATTAAENVSLEHAGSAPLSLKSEDHLPPGDANVTAPDIERYHTPPRSTGDSDENEKDANRALGNDSRGLENEKGLVQAGDRAWTVSAGEGEAVISKGFGPISLSASARLEDELHNLDH